MHEISHKGKISRRLRTTGLAVGLCFFQFRVNSGVPCHHSLPMYGFRVPSVDIACGESRRCM